MSGQTNALKGRAVIEGIVHRVVAEMRPSERYATVTEYALGASTAKVIFVGEETQTDNVHTVRVGAIAPAGAGSKVRIGGIDGDRRIVDVLGEAAFNGSASGTITDPGVPITVPSGVGVVVLGQRILTSWNPVPGSNNYTIKIVDLLGAPDRTFTATGAQFVTPTDLPIGDYTVAVATTGPPVGVYSTPVGFSIVAVNTDGEVPGDSPDVTCLGSIGMISANWPAAVNDDPVTYDVYASNISGFTPTEANKLGETTATFWQLTHMPNGDRVSYTNNTFVRVWARDADGKANVAGAQGFATAARVETGDVGNINVNGLSDGDAPASSPGTPTVRTGIGFAYLKWDHVGNDDEVEYEIHVSNVSGFTPTANTLVNITPSNFSFVRSLGPGLGQATIDADVTYYGRVWAKDKDGYSPTPSPQFQIQTVRVGSNDILEGAIEGRHVETKTITSALIADAAIGTAHIQNAAITNAQIANLSVSSAKIQTAAIGSAHIANAAIGNAQIQNAAINKAKISNAAIGTAQIENAAITNAKIANFSADKITTGSLSGDRIDGGIITGTSITGVTITGGLVTGARFQTAASGKRVVIDGGEFNGEIQLHSPAGLEARIYGLEDRVSTDDGFRCVTTPSILLQVQGSVAFKSPTAPTFTFQESINTGVYLHEIGTLGLAANGTSVMRLSDTAMVANTKVFVPGMTLSTAGGNTVRRFATSGNELFAASSSSELKDSIVDAPDQSALMTARIRVYDPMQLGEDDDAPKLVEPERSVEGEGINWGRIGGIAEEWVKDFPQAVIYEDGKPVGIDESVVLFSLLDCMQRQEVRLTAVENI